MKFVKQTRLIDDPYQQNSSNSLQKLSAIKRRTLRIIPEIEQLVIFTRLHLYNYERHYGAKAIRERLDEENIRPLPSISAINRILSNNYLANARTGYYPEDYS